MAIVRWRPMGDLVTMQDEMNRVFEDLWHRNPRSGSLGPVDASNVKARFEDGVLTITLPKSEESRPREISIDS